MNSQPIRVLIVDDHVMVRMGLASLVKDSGDMVLVGEARTGGEGIALYGLHHPDVTLMDGILPDMHGADAIRSILGKHPDARIILISINETAEDVRAALRAGARGYVPKSLERRTIVEAIRTVAAGRDYLPDELTARLEGKSTAACLTTREVEVLTLIARGYPNKQIADLLGLSDNTVKTHIAHIFAKLEAPDRTRAATLAIEKGIIKP
jgi:two-component system, NarL family, response regulator